MTIPKNLGIARALVTGILRGLYGDEERTAHIVEENLNAATEEVAAPLRAQLKELTEERDRLKDAMQDFADNGAHHDTNPTNSLGPSTPNHEVSHFYLQWIESMDSTVRHIAKTALGEP